MCNLGENNFNELPMQNKWKLILSLVSCCHQQSETNISSCDVTGNFYDAIYLFDAVAVLASTIGLVYVVYRGVQPAARGQIQYNKVDFYAGHYTRQPVWNEGAARGLICLIALGPSVIKVAHPYDATICETCSLVNACDLHPDDHRAPGGRCTASSF